MVISVGEIHYEKIHLASPALNEFITKARCSLIMNLFSVMNDGDFNWLEMMIIPNEVFQPFECNDSKGLKFYVPTNTMAEFVTGICVCI